MLLRTRVFTCSNKADHTPCRKHIVHVTHRTRARLECDPSSCDTQTPPKRLTRCAHPALSMGLPASCASSSHVHAYFAAGLHKINSRATAVHQLVSGRMSRDLLPIRRHVRERWRRTAALPDRPAGSCHIHVGFDHQLFHPPRHTKILETCSRGGKHIVYERTSCPHNFCT